MARHPSGPRILAKHLMVLGVAKGQFTNTKHLVVVGVAQGPPKAPSIL